MLKCRRIIAQMQEKYCLNAGEVLLKCRKLLLKSRSNRNPQVKRKGRVEYLAL